MIIKRATKQDLSAIRHLMSQYGKMSVDESLFNNKDVALQVRSDTGEVIGFIWCGLIARNTQGYVDKFVIHPEYSRLGLGNKLALALRSELIKRGVKEMFGFIKQDQYHDKSAMNCLKLAMKTDNASYTSVGVNLMHSVKELQALGDFNG